MAARLVAIEKWSRVIPVVIGEVCRRLIAKLVLQYGGAQAKEACGSVNLCTGLQAEIEGATHTVREQENIGRGDTG